MTDDSVKKVFIAGGSGMAGRALADHISRNYPHVKIKASCHSQIVDPSRNPEVEYVKCDLRFLEECRSACRDCDSAIMAAAVTGGIAQNVDNPRLQIYDNLTMNTQMLEAFYQEGVKRVIFIGSATCYQPMDQPARESDLDMNIDPAVNYMGVGWVFRYLERLCEFWRQNSDMKIINLRASNIYGPFCKFAPGSSTFLPALIRKAVDKMLPFEVWGSPDTTRNVIYVEEFAAKVAMLLMQKNFESDVFNIGHSKDISVGEAVKLILRLSGHDVEPVYVQTQYAGTKSRPIDISKLEAKINAPTVSLEEGIGKTIEWWEKNRSNWNR